MAALSNLHSIDIIHHDVKPDNVLISPSGHLVLADFGLASRWTKDENSVPDYIGTPGYMAWEVLMGIRSRSSFAADVFSMGIVIFELVLRMRTTYFDGSDKEIEEQMLKGGLPLDRIADPLLRDLLSKVSPQVPLSLRTRTYTWTRWLRSDRKTDGPLVRYGHIHISHLSTLTSWRKGAMNVSPVLPPVCVLP